MSQPAPWRRLGSLITKRTTRKWRIGLLAVTVAAAVAIPVGFATADVNTTAKPAFKMPFSCGKTFYANNWKGHNPSNSIDWQSYGGDGVDREPVKAAASGTVTTVRDLGNDSYGKYIVISHGGGWQTLYAHLSSFNVKVNQKVTTASTIGNVGNTGGSQGAHLHFEEKLNGSVQTPVVDGTTVAYGAKKALKSKNCGGSSGNPYTAGEVCGSGYSKIDSAAIKSSGKTVGTAYLMYNASNGSNCVTTLKATNLGKGSAVSAYLEVKGGTRASDSGSFDYYAGPVKKAAAKKCVKWGGSVGSAKYDSAFEHCG
jgi:hypothetical protein